MNNIWGKSDLASSDGSPAIDKSGVYFTDGDMYITTTKNHKIYLNFRKENTLNNGTGDLIINEGCSNANAQIATGNLTIANGSLSANNVISSGDFSGSNNIITPCFQTSTTGFNPADTFTFYSEDYAVVSDNIINFPLGELYDSITFGSPWTMMTVGTYPSPYLYTLAANQVLAGAYIADITIPENIAGEVIISLETSIKNDFVWISNGTLNYYTDNRPISNISSPISSGTWYQMIPTDVVIQQSIGGGLFEDFPTVVYFQWIAPDSTQTSTIKTINYTSYGTVTNTVYFDNGIFNYRFVVPAETEDTVYRLFSSMYTNFAAGGSVSGGSLGQPVTFTQSMVLNHDVESVKYTVQQTNVAPPSNTTLGISLVNAFNYKQLIPRYSTGWFEVATSQSYYIAHNLNMNNQYPLRYTIFWSNTMGGYPQEDVSYDVNNSYVMQITSANEMQFNSLLRVANPLGVAKTTGYWNISLY